MVFVLYRTIIFEWRAQFVVPHVDISISVMKCIIAPFINHHATSVTNMVVVNHRQFLRLHVCFDVFDSFSDEVHFEELIQSFKDCQSYLYLHHGEDYGNPYALVVVDFHVPSPVELVYTNSTNSELHQLQCPVVQTAVTVFYIWDMCAFRYSLYLGKEVLAFV